MLSMLYRTSSIDCCAANDIVTETIGTGVAIVEKCKSAEIIRVARVYMV